MVITRRNMLGLAAAAPFGGAILDAHAASPTEGEPADGFFSTPANLSWDENSKGRKLDTQGLKLQFDSTFNKQSTLDTITPDGGRGPWFAPIHSQVGQAAFRAPDYKPSPFAIVDGVLRIRCENINGGWQTGHMQTSDTKGNGFAQQRGYFEIKCKMPAAGTLGAWPAFWLYSRSLFTQRERTRAEIDVIEYYPGRDSRGHHSSLHLRRWDPTVRRIRHWHDSDYTTVQSLADGGWHTFGAEVTASNIIFYYDRIELKRTPMFEEFDTPLFLLVSLQMLPSEWKQATRPFDLLVEYVRVWSRA